MWFDLLVLESAFLFEGSLVKWFFKYFIIHSRNLVIVVADYVMTMMPRKFC
jgi:hypothetical protein